jgi:hypothetical protein
MGNRPRLLQQTVLRFIADLEELERAILMQFISKAGKIKPAHQIFDIEGCYRKHARAISPLAL